MTGLVLTTYDWVPDAPRGHVRDLRIRWALEEAALPYRVESTPFKDRQPDHFAHQPFGQVPWLTDGDMTIFESGAILLHLGELSPALLATDPKARNEAIEWLFGALNSIEMASVPWSMFHFMNQTTNNPMFDFVDGWVKARMQHMEPVLARRGWLAGDFSIADIAMTDVLRLVNRFGGLADAPTARAYIARATARPAYIKAHADQMAHFAAAD